MQQLCRDAPRSAGQHRAEARVLDDADDHLDPARHHALDDEASRRLAGGRQPPVIVLSSCDDLVVAV